MSSKVVRMERRELRHDRHTVALSTDHTVFSPKQTREILAGIVALALDGIIRKTCKGLNIEIIDMAVNVDHGWEVAREIHTESGETEYKNAVYRLWT